MDLLLARLSQLEDQVTSLASLPSVVARLSSENEAHHASITRLSSENVALRTEVAQLKMESQDRELVIGELVRTSSTGGFWVWESRGEEGKEDEGRWLWSLEKYKVLTPLAVAAGPSTSLLSLPFELLTIILKLLGRREWLGLCEVSFGLLQLASKLIYNSAFELGPTKAYNFVGSRVFHPAPKSERISSLLLPIKVQFSGRPLTDAFKGLVDLASTLPNGPSSLPLRFVSVECFDVDDFAPWMDLLSFLDPVHFQLWIGDDDEVSTPPTIRFVPADFVDSFTAQWSRLKRHSASGTEAVLLVEGTERTSVFEACLRRCSPDLPHVRVEFWSRTADGVDNSEVVREDNLLDFLDPLEGFEEGFELVSLDFRMEKAWKRRRRDLDSSTLSP